ncbi:hypothetical protein [Pontibacter sp. BAB1700]|uniref:hypothetical protein n=1 Tax=Pontibacter sp. BAB1700 TaxID=1144253 RepID=UPI00026BC98D|nr:hypothetical protein [Pontibacter sp. BAB1700]EJF10601.1 hypothetical protein O71_08178 [Pontibacter sp. BAB1700]
MSALSTLVNNYDLILENKLEIMGHAPYRFSRVTFPKMRDGRKYRVGGDATSIYDGHLGSYLMIWENFQKQWPDSDIILLRAAGSPLSGAVFSFAGYARTQKQLVREKPEGLRTGHMLRFLSRFRQMFPKTALAVPIEQVVEELKSNGPFNHRPSYRLLTLREDFYYLLATVSGIQRKEHTHITYSLLQDSMYRPVVRVGAVLQIELTHDERRRSALSGSAVYVADLVKEEVAKLNQLADNYGFEAYMRPQISNSVAEVEFDLKLADFDKALEMETIQRITAFMHDVDRLCSRFY